MRTYTIVYEINGEEYRYETLADTACTALGQLLAMLPRAEITAIL